MPLRRATLTATGVGETGEPRQDATRSLLLMGHETELKFVGPEDALARLRKSPTLRKLARRNRPKTREMHAVYFDTDDFALCEADYVMRVRTEGDGFIQTVKSANGPDVATRMELKAKVVDFSPDVSAISEKRVRRQVERALKKKVLKPIFAVDVKRTTVLLTPRPGAKIEAAFDVGTIRTLGDKSVSRAPIAEFELELIEGSPSDLIACARELTAGLPLTLFLQSKATRGYALARDAAEAPVSAGSIVLPPKATANEAFATIVTHSLRHLLGNWSSVTIAREPEGIHQMRVALRRLRSALSLFGGPFRAALHNLESDVRWISQVMGAARDLDVFQDEVLRPAAEAHGEDERLLELSTVVRARRRIAWHDVLEALESERFRHLALELAAVTYSRPWLDASLGGAEAIRPAAEFAHERLTHRHRVLLKHGRNVDELDARERHEVRIKLKKLRYAIDFFSSLLKTGETRRFLKRMSKLQDILGHMNDATVARTLVRELLSSSEDGSGAAAIGYAGGVVAGWHLGRTKERADRLKKLWRRFARQSPPWA